MGKFRMSMFMCVAQMFSNPQSHILILCYFLVFLYPNFLNPHSNPHLNPHLNTCVDV